MSMQRRRGCLYTWCLQETSSLWRGLLRYVCRHYLSRRLLSNLLYPTSSIRANDTTEGCPMSIYIYCMLFGSLFRYIIGFVTLCRCWKQWLRKPTPVIACLNTRTTFYLMPDMKIYTSHDYLPYLPCNT